MSSLANLATMFETMTGIPMEEAVKAFVNGRQDEMFARIDSHARANASGNTLRDAVWELQDDDILREMEELLGKQ